MIETSSPYSFGLWRFSIACLAALSFSSFALSAWLTTDFRHEQAIIEKITTHLPASDLPEVRELARDLQLHSRLLLLLVVNLFGSAIALTLLVRAYLTSERHLRKVRVQAEDILASLDQGVITADQEGNLLNVNPKGLQLLGEPFSETRIESRSLRQYPGPLDEMRQRVLEGRKVDEQQYCVEQKQHLRYLRAGSSLLRDHDENPAGVVIHLRDVTEKTLMQQRLLRMERYMGLGSLAAGLQHEIKNPLSALALHVQLLEEGLSRGNRDDSIDDSLEVLRTEVRRITRVLESFRDFASIKQLDTAPIDLHQLVERTFKLTRVEAEEKQITMQLLAEQNSGDSGWIAMVDSMRMEQVLLNLVVNAFAAMPHGGHLILELKHDDEQFVITVTDTGNGIPEELQDKVFDPYFTTRSTGTGMGLALCDKIVRQHDGTIDFISSDAGTSFSIRLPRLTTEG